jgi:branched-chain amino acid transport system ATP-binding protein
MLKVKNLNIYYGAIHANKGININVKEGEIVCLLGANGAGKTTLLRGITGLVKPKNGEIEFGKKRLNDISPHERVSHGIALVPEGRGIFPGLSVKENLMVGAHVKRKDKKNVESTMNELLIKFPILKERLNQKAGTLSGGEQQMLAISRGLMSRPRLILLDEPSMGLSPIVIAELFKLIKLIREEGTTVLLVEQNANVALQIADRGYILTMGEITLSDSAAKLCGNDLVRAAYLT